MTKLCKTCNINKNEQEFGVSSQTFKMKSKCKSCEKAYFQDYYISNKDHLNNKAKEYAKQNRNKFNTSNKKWIQNNKETLNLKLKYRRQNDHLFKMRENLRRRLRSSLNRKNWDKTTKFSEYIGCSLIQLKTHLENQFKDGMNWKNYGDWHIDHIVPLSSATNENELYNLCHYSNLQPLWAEENFKKSNK